MTSTTQLKCYKCEKPLDDSTENCLCEGCNQWFCRDCVTEPVHSMAPYICFPCEKEAIEIAATEATLQRPD